MIVFSVDAGPTRWGCASVRNEDGRLVLVEGIHRVIDRSVAADIEWLRARVGEVLESSGVVLAEEICGYAFQAARVAALVETARSEGVLEGISKAMGARHKYISAKEVRGALCHNPTASDAEVAVVVEWLYGSSVRTLMRADARPHIYDALLLAAYGISKELGTPIKLSPNVEVALCQARTEEKAARVAKRLRKKERLPVERRKPTRAQSKRRSDAAKRASEGKKAA